ncbi:MAG: flavin reductase [Anaerolineae bacterium]|nr:flavin reductase [Anaerolineae bacterium]
MQLRHDMLTHGVYVVCAAHEGVRGGLAVAWGTQVGTDRMLICVGAQSATRPLILDAGAFGLSVLRADQLEVARAFGRRSGKTVDKLAGVAYHTAETGAPLLDDCALAFDCRVVAVHDLGRQKLIVGQIVAAERFADDYQPLVYREDDY